jgi:hypothetical protein
MEVEMDDKRLVNMDEFLLEALLSQENRIKIAKLLFRFNEGNLMATQLEDIHFHSQAILDKYCVMEEQCD